MKQLMPVLFIPVMLAGIISSTVISNHSTETNNDKSPETTSEETLAPVIAETYLDSFDGKFIYNNSLFGEGWAELSHVKFWKDIFNLAPEISIINISTCRTPLGTIPTATWLGMNTERRKVFRDSLIRMHDLDSTIKIFVTSGKNHFYKFTLATPHIPPSIEVFNNHGVDPWYAQTILLIESPGNNHARSSVGAVGPFQLMRPNAVRAGLTVNSRVDERSDLARSAYASARLIKDICLPHARRIAANHGLEYNETDLWFRLLVLHIYHAGAGNVAGVLDVINPTRGGMELIQQMWQTEYRGFKNQSQNYSQIALAALVSKQNILAQIALAESMEEVE